MEQEKEIKVFYVNRLPSLIYNTKESAQKEANRLNLDICRIIYIDNWSNERKEKFIGYGLTDNKKLLGTKDFIFI